MFTWIPFYEELASLILTYRNRQGDLIEILKAIKDSDLPVISLEDRDSEGGIPLDEIDPFTFFATFNRGIKDQSRIEILKIIKNKMHINEEVPSDFEGIPVVNMMQARFFLYKKDRSPGDIEALWNVAEAAVLEEIQAMKSDLFQRCLEIKTIGLPKLTVGLFWLRPNKFMPFDRISRSFFKQKGVSIDVHDFDTYKNFLQKVRGEFTDDFPTLSLKAYEGDVPPPGIGYWQIAPGEQARLWDDLRSHSIAAVGWAPLNFDLTDKSKEELFELYKQYYPTSTDFEARLNATSLRNFINLQPGDKFVTNKGKSILLGLGIVKGTYKFKPERAEYKHTIEVDYYKVSETGVPIPVNYRGKFGKTITPLTETEFEEMEKLFGPNDVKSRERQYWIFQANPEYYDLKGALRSCKEIYWKVVQHRDKIQIGDTVFLWNGGKYAGIYGIAEVLTEPKILPENPCEEPFIIKPEKFPSDELRVRLSIKSVTERPILKETLLKEPVLSKLPVIIMPRGSNFLLTSEQAQILNNLIQALPEPNIWWVNQGATQRAEMEGGFLWAPLKTKTGRSMSHWETMAEVSQDDIVVHYANGVLRYVSKVLEPAVETPKPASLKEGDWSKDGRLVRVEYHELTPPIPIQKFADALRSLNISQGPVGSSGGVKQGYLFRLTREALEIIQRSQLETIWPDFAKIAGPTPTKLNPEYPLSQIAVETGFLEETLGGWLRAIERKGQAIIYGPPGTGKTYIAEKMALHLIGGGDGFQEVVQFHPAYSYEDFIQGIRPKARPDGSLDYPVVPGRFLEFCKRSRSCQGRCVLVIDEINRANLAQVFGELMYLIEYRNREVPLASGSMFQIPTNIRLIGTMNTADRSIALVDHALRRRFAFLRLYPNYEVLSKYHANTGFPVENLIQTLRHLNNQIGDPHYEVGISFFLREDLASQIKDIWSMEIEPYLEEYFFDQPEKVGEFRWNNVQKKIMP